MLALTIDLSCIVTDPVVIHSTDCLTMYRVDSPRLSNPDAEKKCKELFGAEATLPPVSDPSMANVSFCILYEPPLGVIREQGTWPKMMMGAGQQVV